MEDAKAWKGMGRVSAPAEFEDRVLAELDRRRRAASRDRKARLFKWALSGSAAALLAVFTLLNLSVFGPRAGSSLEEALADVPVIESVDYGREVRAGDPETVYLLEQVSDASPSMIRY